MRARGLAASRWRIWDIRRGCGKSGDWSRVDPLRGRGYRRGEEWVTWRPRAGATGVGEKWSGDKREQVE